MTFKTTFGRIKLGTQLPSISARDLTHLPTIEDNPLAKPKEQNLPTIRSESEYLVYLTIQSKTICLNG